jgi:hypothetical protein
MTDPTSTNPTVPSTPDPSDAHIDAALRDLAAQVSIPGEERAHAAAEAPAPIVLAEARPAHRRRSRWLAAGSALAACMAGGALLWTTSGRSEVRAAEILASLRQAQFQGLDIELDGLSAGGATIDGLIRLRLQRPVALEQLADDQDGRTLEDAGFGGVHARLHVTTGPSVEGWANADLNFECAFTPTLGWAYARASDASVDQLVHAYPQAQFFADMARHGLIVNTGPITPDMFTGGGNAVYGFGIHPDAPDADAGGHGAVSIRAHVNGTDDPDDVHAGVQVSVSPRPGAAGPDEATMDRLARAVMTGRAGQRELDEIKNLLLGENQRATVENLGGGRYALTADLGEPGVAGPDASVRVIYEQDAGVRSVEIRPLKDAAGVIRLTMAADPLDAPSLDYQRLVQPGTTGYLDLQALRGLMGGALGGFGAPGAGPGAGSNPGTGPGGPDPDADPGSNDADGH